MRSGEITDLEGKNAVDRKSAERQAFQRSTEFRKCSERRFCILFVRRGWLRGPNLLWCARFGVHPEKHERR